MIAPGISIQNNVQEVHARIERACATAKRDPGDVTLIAVSKYVDRVEVDTAYDAGVRHFGENRVHEIREKYETPLPSDAKLHFVGYLQSNKAAQAAALSHLIHSVDRGSLIKALEKYGEKRKSAVPVLLQVNVAGETQKAGCAPEEVPHLATEIHENSWLDLHGLMTMAPLSTDAETARPVFRQLYQLRDNLLETHADWNLPILSMGMTDDFEVAIQEGATHVRIGRAIFGG